jgi:omega-amidase
VNAPTNDALRITLVQADTAWHDPYANRARHTAALVDKRGATDLVILPETFTTGFSNAAVKTAEGMDGESVAWMKEQARTLDAAVTGSIQIRDGDGVYNRLIFATPDGKVQLYDKRHLFRMAREHEVYASGSDRLIVEWRGWRICPLVCYDLRFPVYARNQVDASRGGELEYDLLLYVANWPASRHVAWRTLLRARAIENLCCVAGVNRAGTDGNGYQYLGGSAVLDAFGQYVVECDAAPQVTDATISLHTLREQRKKFPAFLDADRFTLED